MEVLITQ